MLWQGLGKDSMKGHNDYAGNTRQYVICDANGQSKHW